MSNRREVPIVSIITIVCPRYAYFLPLVVIILIFINAMNF